VNHELLWAAAYLSVVAALAGLVVLEDYLNSLSAASTITPQHSLAESFVKKCEMLLHASTASDFIRSVGSRIASIAARASAKALSFGK
jgi:hypothetical protein